MKATDRDKMEAISNGISRWVYDHPVSAFDCIRSGAENAMAAWLEKHGQAIAEGIAIAASTDPTAPRPHPEFCTPLADPDADYRSDHDELADSTPGEVREGAYRRGVDHGFHMAMLIVKHGGDLQKLKEHADELSEWRLRINRYQSINRAEVVKPPWPPRGVR
jgi:hypothetical protein